MELDVDFFNEKKVLITGGGGYLGSKLAERLSNTNTELYLLDIRFNKVADNLAANNLNISKLFVDLTNIQQLNSTCQSIQPDYIFHFGALLDRERDFSLFDRLYSVNVKGTLNLLESLKSVDYKGFYFASSSEVYGTKNKSPFHEDQIPLPASPYSLTKLMAEHLISTFSEQNHKPYTLLRIFNFYGPEMPKNFFLSQLESSLDMNVSFDMTEGEQKRDYLSIDDLVKYILTIPKLLNSNERIINLCSGTSIALRELAKAIAAKKNKTYLLRIGALPYRDNEIWEMVGDNKKLLMLLNENETKL